MIRNLRAATLIVIAFALVALALVARPATQSQAGTWGDVPDLPEQAYHPAVECVDVPRSAVSADGMDYLHRSGYTDRRDADGTEVLAPWGC